MNREELVTAALNIVDLELLDKMDNLSDEDLKKEISKTNILFSLEQRIIELEKVVFKKQKLTISELKKMTEKEIIEVGKKYGFEWTTKGTKKEKITALSKVI